jgi:hypothetical protein
MIDFMGVDLIQAANVYAGMSGGSLDRQKDFPQVENAQIYFKTVTALSKEEVIYAFKTLFAWENVELKPSGNKLFQVVNISQ